MPPNDTKINTHRFDSNYLKTEKKSLDSHHSSMDKQTEFCLYLSILFRNVKGNVYNNMVEYKMYLPREREFVNKEFMFPFGRTF